MKVGLCAEMGKLQKNEVNLSDPNAFSWLKFSYSMVMITSSLCRVDGTEL